MPFAAAVVAGGAIVGSIISAKGAKDAAKSQSKASQKGIDAELQMFREGQEATAPWREAGERALGKMDTIYGLDEGLDPYDSFEAQQARLKEGFTESPGYTYQLEQANKAAMRSASAGGMSGSGAEMKELQRIAQGQAQGEWGNYLNSFNEYTNSLKSIAGVGQTTATQGANRGANVASSVAGGYRNIGAAQAQAEIGKANAISGAIEEGVGAYGMYRGYNTPTPRSHESDYMDRTHAIYGRGGGGGSYSPYGMAPEPGMIQAA